MVAERLAKVGDVDREDAVANKGFRPDQVEELLLADQSSGVANQGDQHVVGLWLEGDGTPVSREAALSRVEEELREGIPLGGEHDASAKFTLLQQS